MHIHILRVRKPWTRVGKWFENEMKIVLKQFENHWNFKFAFRCIAQKPRARGDFKNKLANQSYFTLVRLRAENNLEIRSYFLISISDLIFKSELIQSKTDLIQSETDLISQFSPKKPKKIRSLFSPILFFWTPSLLKNKLFSLHTAQWELKKQK